MNIEGYGMAELADLVEALLKKGIVFKVVADRACWTIRITGY